MLKPSCLNQIPSAIFDSISVFHQGLWCYF
nr:MAG TPA: hypothetical protein [Caudoviricetes sp.]